MTQQPNQIAEWEDLKSEFFDKAIAHENGGGFIKTDQRDGFHYRDTEIMWNWVEDKLRQEIQKAREGQMKKDIKIILEHDEEVVAHCEFDLYEAQKYLVTKIETRNQPDNEIGSAR